MKILSKIYRFVRTRVKENKQQSKELQPPQQKQQLPPKPPIKRILITYGIFSLLFIILATAAWFFKRTEWLPEYTTPQTNTSQPSLDVNTTPNYTKDALKKEDSVNEPASATMDTQSVDSMERKVKQLKDEIRQMDAELDIMRIQHYLANADYLIDTGISPERALPILQSLRADIESNPGILKTGINVSLQDIDDKITALKKYIKHSPKKALVLLAPLITDIETQLGAMSESPTNANTNLYQGNDSRIKEWPEKVYDVGRSLLRIERTDNHYKNNQLLLKLLISARSAVLLNEQEQFYISLKDTLKIIDTMPQPSIRREQVEDLLSLKIIWQLPKIQP